MENGTSTKKPKPTQRQSYLNRVCRGSESFAEELKSINLSIIAIINSKEYIDSTFSALEATRKHIEKAINRLEKLAEETYKEWSELYDNNSYW